MAHIRYVDPEDIPEEHRLDDDDNILRIHGVNAPTARLHYDLYRHLMYAKGPLTRAQREMIAVVVSGANECHY